MVKLCLSMIVKNESKIIKRCIEQALPLVDAICITDTGSTDDTVELINSYKDNIKVKCVYHEWTNFGHNRSLSFIETKKFCTELGWNLSTSYALQLDADMIIVAKNFNKHGLTAGSYKFIQKNEFITYYNVRLSRLDYNWKCVGVTHEYWDPLNENIVTDKIDTIWINDIGDGGSKADKTERDIRLLEKGIEEEPNNRPRYFFYLAQTFKDNGKYDKAIELYKKRIACGGWYEEVWYAYYMIGLCYEGKEMKYEASLWYRIAFDFLDTRSEPLIKLAEMARREEKYFEAYSIAKRAKKVSYPIDDVLFIENSVYAYMPDFIISISGYFIGKHDEAAESCENVLTCGTVLGPHKEITAFNSMFYSVKCEAKAHVKLNKYFTERYNNSSISFAVINKHIYVLTRHVSYYIASNGEYKRDIENKAITRNILWKMNKYGELIQPRELIEPNIYTKEHLVIGLEDVRLFVWENELWGMATTQRYKAWEHQMCMFPIDISEDITDIETLSLENRKPKDIILNDIYRIQYKNGNTEKNWLPLSENDKILKVVYNHDPFTILCFVKPTKGTTITPTKDIMYELKHDYKRLRGSTPLIKYNEIYLSLVHEVIFDQNKKRIYLHRFVVYDKSLRMMGVTKRLYFESHGVEYVCGMYFDNSAKSFVIGYSTNDCTSNIIKFGEDDFKKLIMYKCE